MSSADALDALVDACPSYRFADDLGGYVGSFEEADEPDAYVRASAFAHHLVALMATRDVEEVAGVFATADRMLAEADPESCELVSIGLLESLANITSHPDISVSPLDVRSLLGPIASVAWDDNQELWFDAAHAHQSGLRVTAQDYDGVADPNLRRYLQSHKRRLDDGTLMGVAEVVRYQDEVAKISPITPAGRPSVPWPAVFVGLVFALVVVVSLVR